MSAHQPFPDSGELSENLNLSLSNLKSCLRSETAGVHSYVVRSVKWDRGVKEFLQRGSAPNFQGGYITLCTCKHQMRATQDCNAWKNTWIAGFASLHRGYHYLFYLAKIRQAFESQYDLWKFLQTKPKVFAAKSATKNCLGDAFTPNGDLTDRQRFDPARYTAPVQGHTHRSDGCDRRWFSDINYKYEARYKRQPSLLVADPQFSFLWREPTIQLNEYHCRNFRIWTDIKGFLKGLQ